MYAWRTCDSEELHPRGSRIAQGSHDNGESGAGIRLQGLIDRTGLVNVLIVVSRWYGDKPLGPARFRCITDVAMEAIRKSGFDSVTKKGSNSHNRFIDMRYLNEKKRKDGY